MCKSMEIIELMVHQGNCKLFCRAQCKIYERRENIVKVEPGDRGRRQIITWSVNEFGLYTKVNGKPVGK